MDIYIHTFTQTYLGTYVRTYIYIYSALAHVLISITGVLLRLSPNCWDVMRFSGRGGQRDFYVGIQCIDIDCYDMITYGYPMVCICSTFILWDRLMLFFGFSE